MSEPIKHEINISEPDPNFSRPEYVNPNFQLCTCFRCAATILIRPGLDERPMHLHWHYIGSYGTSC